MMKLSAAAKVMGARLVGKSGSRLSRLSIAGVSIDSRTLLPGELFFALGGPNFDGHQFVDQAAANGAIAAVVSRPLETRLPQLLVAHTAQALFDLAADWRQRFVLPLVGITGSSGKTTVKEMIAGVLRQVGSVLATRGNLNNHLGVPLTLLRLRSEHQAAVIEMGMSNPGEIARLSKLAEPSVSVITNAGRAHLQGVGSLQGVAEAKGEIVQGTREVLVLNREDPYFEYWRNLGGALKVVGFGFGQKAEVWAEFELLEDHSVLQVHTPSSAFPLRLGMPGRHNVLNALAAIAVAQELGVDDQLIRRGLEALGPAPGRLVILPGLGGGRLIDDSYNANPLSVGAAIDVLQRCSGKRIFVLGDLAELGPEASSIHQELGRLIAESGIDVLFTLGTLSTHAAIAFGAGARHFESMQLLTEAIRPQMEPGVTVLVKGSRSAGMDRLVKALSERGES